MVIGRGQSQSRPMSSRSPCGRPGLNFWEAWAGTSRAWAGAFRPSRSRKLKLKLKLKTLHCMPDSAYRHSVELHWMVRNGYSVSIRWVVKTVQCSLPMWQDMTRLFRPASPSCLLVKMASVPNAKTSLMTSKLTLNSLTWITLRSSCCFRIQNTANGSQISKNVSRTTVDVDILCRIFGNRSNIRKIEQI